jgi:protein-S-isoprenylcysteine O-methyltransferase Ste14
MADWSKIARRIRVPLGFAFAVLYFWLARPSVWSIILGLCGIVPGLLIRALASGHVRKNESLTSSGPYAYTRNPLYLGSLLIGLGFTIAARSWWIAAALAVMFAGIYLPVIRDEERFLRIRFQDFAEYERTVPRILPRLRGTRDPDPKLASARFSPDLYLKHREYNALLGSLAMLAALIAKIAFTS